MIVRFIMFEAPLAGNAVIIGGGQAGAQCAISLRQSGWPGGIILLCAEELPPYQRPPLSKTYLSGELDAARLLLREPDFYRGQGIDLRLGVGAAAIDRRDGVVVTSEADVIPYDRLFVATGSRPRRLETAGPLPPGVAYLRDAADVDRIGERFRSANNVLVVGAGYIGLEVAAVAAKAGKRVTVAECAERVLTRVAGPTISDYYQTYHSRLGVELRLGTSVVAFGGEGELRSALLSDGTEVRCEIAIVGIGAAPNDELAMYAGLEVEPGQGTVVDGRMRTSDANVYAIGDCAMAPNRFAGRPIRLESVANAIEQAKIAAADACGLAVPEPGVPWFWSDQGECKLQTAGLIAGGYDTEVVRGDPAGHSFSVLYLRDGELVAVDAVNQPADFTFARRAIGSEAAFIDPVLLADPRTELKSLHVPGETKHRMFG